MRSPVKLLSRIDHEKGRRVILALIFLSAFLLRLAVFSLTIDVPGDGPSRAAIAYAWSKAPSCQLYGVWLPGHSYLAGLFSFFFENPLSSARLFNVMLGTITLPLFYLLIRKVYDPATALISTSILAFLPLHIGLSASSLSEVSFALEIIAGTFFLVTASETDTAKKQAVYVAASILSLCMAVMTRYEAWMFIPVFPLYYFWKTRKIRASILIIAVLMVFPSIWTVNNYLYLGAPFEGFTSASARSYGAQPANLSDAITTIIRKARYHLGWPVSVLAVLGLAIQFLQTAKRNIDAKKMLYILIACIFWAGVLAYAMARGRALYDRYLLFAFILCLPFSALPLSSLISFSGHHKPQYRRQITAGVILLSVALVVSVFYKPHVYTYKNLHRRYTPFFVTLWRPTEIKNAADWVKNSPYRESSVLLTEIEGQSWYFSSYLPEAGERRLVAASYVPDSVIQGFLKTRRPSLLIACDDDSAVIARIEHLLGKNIGDDLLIHAEKFVKVYDISSVFKSTQF